MTVTKVNVRHSRTRLTSAIFHESIIQLVRVPPLSSASVADRNEPGESLVKNVQIKTEREREKEKKAASYSANLSGYSFSLVALVPVSLAGLHKFPAPAKDGNFPRDSVDVNVSRSLREKRLVENDWSKTYFPTKALASNFARLKNKRKKKEKEKTQNVLAIGNTLPALQG